MKISTTIHRSFIIYNIYYYDNSSFSKDSDLIIHNGAAYYIMNILQLIG